MLNQEWNRRNAAFKSAHRLDDFLCTASSAQCCACSWAICYAAPSGAVPGVNTRPAKPGDTVTFYGIGFGPVTPNVPAGTVTSGLTMLASPVQQEDRRRIGLVRRRLR